MHTRCLPHLLPVWHGSNVSTVSELRIGPTETDSSLSSPLCFTLDKLPQSRARHFRGKIRPRVDCETYRQVRIVPLVSRFPRWRMREPRPSRPFPSFRISFSLLFRFACLARRAVYRLLPAVSFSPRLWLRVSGDKVSIFSEAALYVTRWFPDLLLIESFRAFSLCAALLPPSGIFS